VIGLEQHKVGIAPMKLRGSNLSVTVNEVRMGHCITVGVDPFIELRRSHLNLKGKYEIRI
jgi:hypothetical protein